MLVEACCGPGTPPDRLARTGSTSWTLCPGDRVAGVDVTPTPASRPRADPARLACPFRGTSSWRRSHAIELGLAATPSTAACQDGNDSGQREDACRARRPESGLPDGSSPPDR